MRCSRCGNNIQYVNNYCSSCGKKINFKPQTIFLAILNIAASIVSFVFCLFAVDYLGEYGGFALMVFTLFIGWRIPSAFLILTGVVLLFVDLLHTEIMVIVMCVITILACIYILFLQSGFHVDWSYNFAYVLPTIISVVDIIFCANKKVKSR